MYLLDTDTLIYFLKGHKTVVQNFKAHANKPKAISVVTYGELVYGVRKSERVPENMAKIHRLAELYPIIDITRSVMDSFGEIKALLSAAGTTVDDFDLQITSGKLYGLLQGRDVHVQQCIDDLDRLAAALIQEVNKLHAEGQGLSGLTSVTGTYVVDDDTAPLNAAGLDLTPVNGTFEIWVGPDGGEPTATLIHVDLDGLGSDTSLQDLASMLDAVDNISATVAGDGTLQITADNGYSFTFANDNSNVLAALGVNTFFDGHDSASIRVRSELQDSPALIAAGGCKEKVDA